MKPFIKTFLLRGLIFSGLGPIVAGIVYLCLDLSNVDVTISGKEVFMGILTTYIIAFVHAGSSAFNEIEKWGKAKALLCQLSCIYVIYLVGYLINNWIPFDFKVILIFTVALIVGYLIIWFTIYFIVKKYTKKLNEKLIIKQNELN